MNEYAAIMDATERIMYSLRALYYSYGYRRYRMDKFEDYDLYGKNRDFLVSDRLITFTDGTGRLKALKPDVTLSVLRNSHGLSDGIEKYCYNESVYRMGPDGSFHEIPQSGIECIGSVDEACIREVLLLAAKSLAVLSTEYVLSLSELTVLFALISAAAAAVQLSVVVFISGNSVLRASSFGVEGFETYMSEVWTSVPLANPRATAPPILPAPMIATFISFAVCVIILLQR